jgi:tetratricopeptide (TPR) repeat protein
MRPSALVLVFLLAGCGGAAGSSPSGATATPAGSRCGRDLGPSPFQRRDATHILVADFVPNGPLEPNISDTVSRRVYDELERYRDDLPDLEVPKSSLEIQRLRCVVESRDQARAIAEALEADLVVWGNAFRTPTSPVTVNNQSSTNIHTENVSADNGGVNSIGNTEIHVGKAYTVVPSATLFRGERAVRGTIEGTLDLDNIGHLDLPMLESSEPFQLVYFMLGMHFYKREMFPLATRFFKQSLDKVPAGKRSVAAQEMMLGKAYWELGNMSMSLEYSQRALAHVHDREPLLETTLLNNVGCAQHYLHDYRGARASFERATAIAEHQLGEKHPSVAVRLNNLSSALVALGMEPEAMDNYRKAQGILEMSVGRSPDLAIVLNNIGSLYYARQDYARALDHYQRALDIDRQASGVESPNVAVRLNNIGTVLEATGKLDEALAYYRQAIGIDRAALGMKHPTVARDLERLGELWEARGEYDKARDHYQQALEIDEVAPGKDDVTVAGDHRNLGGAWRALGDHDKARECYGRALIIYEEKLGGDHPRTAQVRELMDAIVKEAHGVRTKPPPRSPGGRRSKRSL